MNDEAAAKLVLTMQTAWSGFAEDDAANRMWATVISRSEPAVGAAACKALIGHLKRRPTVADWNEAIREAHRYIEPGSARAELGYSNEPMDPNVAHRVNQEFKTARKEREHRRRTMDSDDFIRSEGHDPTTHWLNPSGFVLKRVGERRRDR